ncbi:MAG TPA: M3 family metallopeptidase [Steroidobacteraceae bacterium]|nr:M3 family metallopeptidase [Steroidobacteraceae bacterium]
MDNPLLQASQLPRFSAFDPDRVEPAIRQLLDDNRREIAALLDDGASGWDGLVAPLERMQHALASAWSPVGHLNGVMNGDRIRAAYNACLPLLTAYHTELAQNARLCAAYQRVYDTEGARLDEAQRTLLEHALRDFRLSGVSLPDDRKRRFGEVMERLATVQAKFDENVLDATNAWSRHIDLESQLDGLPPTTVERARRAAAESGRPGWLLALDAPNYQAVMTHASDAELRREFYEAWTTRASDQGPHAGRWDNTGLMAEILGLRHEAANLVGFADYAQYSLATKMARETGEVLSFLRELARLSRPAAEREFADLERYSGRKLEAWDVAYWSERLKHERFEVSAESLRPYFPVPRVLAGLFTVVSRLYRIRIVARAGADVYHPDVRYFDVLDRDGSPRGGFFVDLYARPKKRGGAWMDDCVGRMRIGSSSALPVAYLVCNFTPPVGDRPSLLTHDEVLTLFHEFGHGLHHMLTRVDYPSVAGINGVPWDAVELPSQFMENFAWRHEVLPLISAHVETGEPLPSATLAKLQATRTFQAGMQTVRQLEFALFDFRLHAEHVPGAPPRIAETLEEVRREVAVVRPPAFNRFPHSFQHIFSGGYAAGYYSYKWAEVLSADAFGAFEEHGVFDRATAASFLRSILERGGSRDAMEAFVEFRGRKPRLEPLLRQMGLAA